MARSRRQQALYGEPAAPVPAPGPPALTRARAEVAAELQERIALGKEIQERFSFRDDMGTYKSDVQRWRDYNLALLQTVFINYDIMIEYRRIVGPSRGGYTETEVLQILHEDVDHQITKLKSIVERLGLYQEAIPQSTIPIEATGSENRSQVFVVHGHDGAPKAEVARFIERLGFEAIILHERPNKGRALITKFREEAADVGFAVVLMTPDDLGKAEKTDDLKLRARQNVVFELGFFIGKLGPERVAALVKGDIELPSDFDGVVYISLDKEDWQAKLGSELEAAEYTIDWNKVMRR
jgi:predicted nucleotide-binding protein